MRPTSRKLLITHTESSLGWGGQEIRILSESRGLMRRGHDVRLLCPPDARIHTEAPNWGVPVVALPIGRKRLKGLSAMIDWLRDNRCDVLNTHSSTDSWLAALALLTLGRPVPIVRTRHISAHVPRNPMSRWLYERAATRIVTTGEALKRQLIEENGISAAKIESVPTGIDSARFRPGDRSAAREALRLPAGRMLVGIVATLRSWKGHRYLLEAFAALPPGAGLLIVGDGPQRAALEAQVEKLGLKESVWLPGNQADVLPWLHALDVFALPSYANEGVPQALVQAMLAGLPCVTTTTGSIAELAQNDATALVVAPRDAGALRAALERLLGDAALRARLASAARAHCVERFSEKRMLDRMEAIYRDVSARA